jgi:hypothetical protein
LIYDYPKTIQVLIILFSPVDEDSDVEIEYNDRATTLKKEPVMVKKETKKVVDDDEGEDDFNIDDI